MIETNREGKSHFLIEIIQSKTEVYMNCYRVDKRDFAVGSWINSNSNYQDALHAEGLKIEKFLENFRPECKPPRESTVFVFAEWDDAEKYCVKVTNGIIYTVEVQAPDILHRGDMQFTEKMKININDDNLLEQYAVDYWAGNSTNQKIIEIMVRKARVLKRKELSRTDRFELFNKYYQK